MEESEASAIVDLGCGVGRNARELLKRYPKAKLTALDYSEVSVEMTKKTNRQSIRVGRCSVVQGNVAALPFAAALMAAGIRIRCKGTGGGVSLCFW